MQKMIIANNLYVLYWCDITLSDSNPICRYRENIIIPHNLGPVQIKTNEEKLIEATVESCFFKSFMACVLGYGLGAAIGLFSSSVNPNIATPGIEKTQTAREVFREMRSTTHGYAKNFALIGMVFSAVECTIETVSKTNNEFICQRD